MNRDKDSELQGFTRDALVSLVISLEKTEIYQQEIIDKKDAEIERLKNALSVYANTHNWINGFFVADNFYSEKEEGYDLARQALSEVER